MRVDRRLDDAGGKGCSRRLTEPHAKIKQRHFADFSEQRPMGRFRRNMGRHAMVKRAGVGNMENCRRSGCHIAIDEHRNILHSRSQNGPCHGGKFAPAQTAQNF